MIYDKVPQLLKNPVLKPTCLVIPVSSLAFASNRARDWPRSRISSMMAKPAVLQLSPALPSLREALEKKFEYYPLWEQNDAESFLAAKGTSIRAVVACDNSESSTSCWGVDIALLAKLPRLEIVASLDDLGLENVDVPLCKKLGVKVANTGSASTDHPECTAIELLKAISREIVAAGRYVRSCRWPFEGTYPTPFRLSNKHVGVIGLGKIGEAVAENLERIGGTIAYWATSAKTEFPAYTFYDNVVDLARHCDILIAACALTKETTKVVNREVLDALGPHGFVVNISRGSVVDEEELVKALVEGRIAGAGLDMFENEYHISKGLPDLDTLVLHSHSEGDIKESCKLQEMVDLVVANLEAHFSGKPLLNPV